MPGRPSFLRITVTIWFALGALFLPFPWHLFPGSAALGPTLFGPLLQPLAARWRQPPAAFVVSDSLQQYLLLALLLLPAVVPALLLLQRPRLANRLLEILHRLLCFYLAAVLLRYGADKLLKSQFYLPEPNTLYTPLGQLDPDLLYWSVMGLSRPYSLFLGGAGVAAALLLCFPRARAAGALLAFLLLLHIAAINLCFGITVKLFSLFLCGLALLLLSLHFRRLCAALGGHATVAPRSLLPPRWASGLRSFLLVVLIGEAFCPVLAGAPFNDDLAPRMPLHGAYAVLEADASFPLWQGRVVQRFFVHRQGYLVAQYAGDQMQSWPLRVDTLTRTWQVSGDGTVLQGRYRFADSLLQLESLSGSILLRARSLPWRQLPALNGRFRWTAD